ncbi:MAG: thioredoxin domain-containing protein [Polyangiaceae bacterium]|nr:thioredoxin domain-containing protein [Polyangiaceae bacterium]
MCTQVQIGADRLAESFSIVEALAKMGFSRSPAKVTQARAWRWILLGGAVLSGCTHSSCAGSGASQQATSASTAANHEALLRARLHAALTAKGADYVPRTRHKNPDGSPKYVNRLILEQSVYLLQHAHNPVNWFAWGDEAFAKARAENKPIFVSVGYSTCHWCHVMEEESFEDEEIAAFLNDHFVSIKVDREVRPDVDDVLMTALLSFSGSGGWPMNVWLTPEKEPFFAGTYFPPRSGVRGARHGFLSVIKELSQMYTTDRAAVVRDAKAFVESLKKLTKADVAGHFPGAAPIQKLAEVTTRRFDAQHGGLSGAPKFPSAFPLRTWPRYARRSGDKVALSMLQTTLRAMQNGGIFDHVGGGFHRYAVDEAWKVPHFEKMLYDAALLARVYTEAGQLAADPIFFATARNVLDALARDMRGGDTLFFSALDADSLAPGGKREEGYFYTWTSAEMGAALKGDAAVVAPLLFGVSSVRTGDNRAILHLEKSPSQLAADLGWEPGRVDEAAAQARAELLIARNKRPAPLRDEKAILAWNALTVSAFARAAMVLGEARYAEIAVQTAATLVREVRQKKPLSHAWMKGARLGDAFLDDYAALALAALDVFELTGDGAWLDDAAALLQSVHNLLLDKEKGGYFSTQEGAETLLFRDKNADDEAVPSGNSLAALAWARLSLFTDNADHRAKSEAVIGAFAARLGASPAASDQMLCTLDLLTDVPKEIVLVIPESSENVPVSMSAGARPFLSVQQKVFVPNAVWVIGTEKQLAGSLGSKVPWAKDKTLKNGRATAYVCERGSCKLPTTDVDTFTKQIEETAPY